MTALESLPEVALAFARDVLDWPDALFRSGSPQVFHGHGGGRFSPDDLDFIMEAARAWCKERGLFISTCTMPELNRVSASVFNHAVSCEAEEADFGHVLMAACLAASRKLKGAAP